MMFQALISFAAGLATWTFGEYAIHNWVGHLGKGRNEFSREHLAHHRDNDYFAPTHKKVIIASIVFAVLSLALTPLLGAVSAIAYVLGFTACYAGYEVLHRRCHTHPPTGPYGRWARKHHFHHHFASPKTNHGVTSPIWDLVFRTYQSPGVVRVPAKKIMSWLCDPQTGEIKPEYAADYVIARPRKRRAAA